MNTRAWPDQFRVQLWPGFYETTRADYGLRTVWGSSRGRFVRLLAGSATLISIDELVLVAQNVRAGTAATSVVAFRSWPRRTAGARPRQPVPVRRRGRSVRCGGSGRQRGCAMRGRPRAISSSGSLQRQPRRNWDGPMLTSMVTGLIAAAPHTRGRKRERLRIQSGTASAPPGRRTKPARAPTRRPTRHGPAVSRSEQGTEIREQGIPNNAYAV